MPEAEVSLRLAFHLLDQSGSDGHASVAIDGAQVYIKGRGVIFPIKAFLRAYGWTLVEQSGRNSWQGTYRCKQNQRLNVHAHAGIGDVEAAVNRTRVRAECKGGPLSAS